MMEHKILLVDDGRDLLEMLCSIFRRAGYTDLVTASSGQEALQIWREQQPALIILDVMMPGMDGFEVLREIRRTSRVPVLMLTARGEAEDRIEGLEIGADDYLPKPFLPKELLLRVGAILYRTYSEPHRTVELAASTVDLEKAEVWKGRPDRHHRHPVRVYLRGVLAGLRKHSLDSHPPPEGKNRG